MGLIMWDARSSDYSSYIGTCRPRLSSRRVPWDTVISRTVLIIQGKPSLRIPTEAWDTAVAASSGEAVRCRLGLAWAQPRLAWDSAGVQGV